jgi:4-azaleucine resistance transporter AzlC
LDVRREFFRGLREILPVLVAAFPIGVLWGALAVKKGFAVGEATLASALVFAGSLQFVALDLWTDPAPWLLLGVTAFIVNLRHVLMGASMSRHVESFPRASLPFVYFLLVDEAWAFAERRAIREKLTLPYYLGLTAPMLVNWIAATLLGSAVGLAIGDPSIYGLDLAFASLFIAILAGFWKGPRTAVVLGSSALAAVAVKHFVPGAWYIAAGGLAGVFAAVAMAETGGRAS